MAAYADPARRNEAILLLNQQAAAQIVAVLWNGTIADYVNGKLEIEPTDRPGERFKNDKLAETLVDALQKPFITFDPSSADPFVTDVDFEFWANRMEEYLKTTYSDKDVARNVGFLKALNELNESSKSPAKKADTDKRLLSILDNYIDTEISDNPIALSDDQRRKITDAFTQYQGGDATTIGDVIRLLNEEAATEIIGKTPVEDYLKTSYLDKGIGRSFEFLRALHELNELSKTPDKDVETSESVKAILQTYIVESERSIALSDEQKREIIDAFDRHKNGDATHLAGDITLLHEAIRLLNQKAAMEIVAMVSGNSVVGMVSTSSMVDYIRSENYEKDLGSRAIIKQLKEPFSKFNPDSSAPFVDDEGFKYWAAWFENYLRNEQADKKIAKNVEFLQALNALNATSKSVEPGAMDDAHNQLESILDTYISEAGDSPIAISDEQRVPITQAIRTYLDGNGDVTQLKEAIRLLNQKAAMKIVAVVSASPIADYRRSEQYTEKALGFKNAYEKWLNPTESVGRRGAIARGGRGAAAPASGAAVVPEPAAASADDVTAELEEEIDLIAEEDNAQNDAIEGEENGLASPDLPGEDVASDPVENRDRRRAIDHGHRP